MTEEMKILITRRNYLKNQAKKDEELKKKTAVLLEKSRKKRNTIRGITIMFYTGLGVLGIYISFFMGWVCFG
ncbi:hypothetical protein [Peptoniphilus raoultii]|uniref:hypothetical protein n=1 Tax=Peptoniphilus raoultii TaxID=1776387 RepID=UPI0008DA3DB4|nr:hypothetical protein [Peptoniphilus raoultii]